MYYEREKHLLQMAFQGKKGKFIREWEFNWYIKVLTVCGANLQVIYLLGDHCLVRPFVGRSIFANIMSHKNKNFIA